MRDQANLIEAAEPTMSQEEKYRRQIHWMEVQRLLELFSYPDFPNSGVITVGNGEATVMLRACSCLRLQLRKTALGSISDATLESSDLDSEKYIGDERQAILCYCFLATLQEAIIQKLPLVAAFSPETVKMWKAFSSAVARLFSKRNQSSDDVSRLEASEVWQVVVLNDPVNLMNYVTTVFRSVLNLPEQVATQRMREVHELKSSIVWKGPKDKAEIHVRALQSWHLQAILRRE